MDVLIISLAYRSSAVKAEASPMLPLHPRSLGSESSIPSLQEMERVDDARACQRDVPENAGSLQRQLRPIRPAAQRKIINWSPHQPKESHSWCSRRSADSAQD
jgi:hypothetical protein